ncbi:type II toxin-antitoxin system prevent-host-death family antitoxin [Hoeflea alexandrii]|uniref:type II toxin-antitoxin system prevent-host-death family antitoxin n=1 Tax=Hoeflea alexandrii TaxID=288436 RepID=UPI0022AF7172|nr:type II toxin-antitoxin system prevent-host-death family antitoxin [Hoeflea alexandrii]MCZ4289806.1 type II toxin-antitoxin system prevent-host-death family antitoxin [Hoeflea alexandrii]
MKVMQASEAKNRFGELLEASATEPVVIRKNGRDIRVVLSTEEYERLLGSNSVDPKVQTSLERSMKRWNKVYEALAK